MREFIIQQWKASDPLGASSTAEDAPEPRRKPAVVEVTRPDAEGLVVHGNVLASDVPPAPEPPESFSETEPVAFLPQTPPASDLAPAQPRIATVTLKRWGKGGQSPSKVNLARPKSAVKNRPQKSPARPARRRGERTFFIAYDGAFVGFFQAETETTPREAFLRVAEELASNDKDFDPAKLEIHKPVLLRGARPAKNPKLVRGKLTKLSSRGEG